MMRISVCIALVCFASTAFAGGWEKYGVTVEPTAREMEEDQQYGGYPNSRLFNNATKCRSVVKLFDAPGMGPQNPRMTAFLTYSRIKLAETDIVKTTMDKTPSVFERMGESWSALPVLFPVYCREHPRDTLEDATWAIYRAAQLANGD